MYASLWLFIGHLYLSVIHPTTRHALNGMTRGWVNESWARKHHGKWAAEAAPSASAALARGNERVRSTR
jgi:cytochrome b subunit of formate dehydrogenase